MIGPATRTEYDFDRAFRAAIHDASIGIADRTLKGMVEGFAQTLRRENSPRSEWGILAAAERFVMGQPVSQTKSLAGSINYGREVARILATAYTNTAAKHIGAHHG